jgi:DNA-binding beta-propeller fold protein YncE
MVAALRKLLLVMTLLQLTACSSLDTESRFVWTAEHNNFPLVWPSADTPRYQYLGDLVGEQNFQQEYSRQNRMSLFWQWLVGEDDKPPQQLERPQGLAVDGEGRVYVSDVGVDAVLMFDTQGNSFSFWGNTEGRQFLAPIGLTIKDGWLLVADSEAGCIWVLDRFSGALLEKREYPQFKQPVGIVWAADRKQFFVSDSQANSLHRLDESLNYLNDFGKDLPELDGINRPTYLAYRPGQLLISETLGARVHLVNLDDSQVLSFGNRGSYVGNLNRPKGVAFDGDGRLYVVESYFDHLLIFNQQGQLLLPIGGSGSEPGNFMLPSAVAIDARQRVFVSDMLNGRVSVFQYLGNEGSGTQ